MFPSFSPFLACYLYIFLRACVPEMKPETFILIHTGFREQLTFRLQKLCTQQLKALNVRILNTI
jgi:hypothetical protein